MLKPYPTKDNVDTWKASISPRLGDYKDPQAALAHVYQSLPFQSYEISNQLAQEIAGDLVKKQFPDYQVESMQGLPPTRQQIRLKNMGFAI